MRVLFYYNRKTDPVMWDASTPEKQGAAFLALFKMLDEDWEVYACGDMTKRQKAWYNKAKAGDANAARDLLTERRLYEYEEWAFQEVKDPLKDE